MEVSLSLIPNEDALRLIKFSMLYYDKIRIDDLQYHKIVEEPIISYSYLPAEIKDMRKQLIDCGIAYGEKRYRYKQLNGWPDKIIYVTQDAVLNSLELFTEPHYLEKSDACTHVLYDSPLIEGEAKQYIEYFLRDKRNSLPPLIDSEHFCIYMNEFYETLLLNNIVDIFEGQNVITNSNVLTELIRRVVSAEDYLYIIKEQEYNRIIKKAVEVLLPDYSSLSLEAILRIRDKASDELTELRSYLDCVFADECNDLSERSDEKIERLMNTKLRPAIIGFNKKVKGLKWDFYSDVISVIKNPLNYTPLLASCFSPISQGLAAMVTAGAVALETAVKYGQNKEKSIVSDPLYFTVNLNKQIKEELLK